MRLVGFIIRIYHNAWSPECQNSKWTSVFLFVHHVLIDPNDLFHCSFLNFLGTTGCVTETVTMSPDSCQFKCLNMSHCLLEDLQESLRYQAIGFHFISCVLTIYLRMVCFMFTWPSKLTPVFHFIHVEPCFFFYVCVEAFSS